MSSKKNDPFVLVRRPAISADSSSNAEQAAMKALTPELAQGLSKLSGSIRQAVVSSVTKTPRPSRSSRASSTPKVAAELTDIMQELTRQERVVTVGLLDLGAWLSTLPRLLNALNAAQPLLTFFQVEAPLPAGMLKTKEHLVDWVVNEQGVPLSRQGRAEMGKNILSDEFFRAAGNIRKNLGLDYLVGLTPYMVAGTTNDEVYWNHLSTSRGRVALLSTADLREFAAQAKRPFETALGSLLVPQILVMMNARLGFHDDRGCLFDYNESRVSLVDVLKHPHIEPECLRLIRSDQRTAALALAQAIEKL